MINDFDIRMKQALTPMDEPDHRLNISIMKRVKELEQMKWDRRIIYKRVAVLGMALMCLISVSAFAYRKFSDLSGDEVGFRTEYLGNGQVYVYVTNSSDIELEFEKQLKLMKWSGEEITGNSEGIVWEDVEIEPNTEGVMKINLSAAYDMKQLEQPLEEGNWYYFVLTNNQFAFGQDWMVSVDFDEIGGVSAKENCVVKESPNISKQIDYEGTLVVSEWIWPIDSKVISSPYGENPINGYFSDHINISGEKGDAVYAVVSGTIVETGFDATVGNYIMLEDGDGYTIKYGHLSEVAVEKGQIVSQGDKIGEVGKSGMVTGCNLYFAVYENGVAIDPLKELQ